MQHRASTCAPGLRFAVAVVGVLLTLPAAIPASAQKTPESGEIIAATTQAIDDILRRPLRLQPLPETVRGVFARADLPPIFQISPGVASADRPAQPIWPLPANGTSARPLFPAWQCKVLAAGADYLWVSWPNANPGDLVRRTGNIELRWPDNLRNHASAGGAAPSFARDCNWQWWTGGPDGLYRLTGGQWVRTSPTTGPDAGPPVGRIAGVISGPDRILWAWSAPDAANRVTLLRFDGVAWSRTLLAGGAATSGWRQAAVRADGRLVLAGPAQLLVVPDEKQWRIGQPLADLTPGRVPLDDPGDHIERWFAISKVLALRADGAATMTGRVEISGTPQREEVLLLSPTGKTATLGAQGRGAVAYPGGGFCLLTEGDTAGLFKATADGKMDRLASSGEVRPDDELLGADEAGRVYLRRAGQIFVFQPVTDQRRPIPLETLADLPAGMADAAAVASDGTTWWVGAEDGAVLRRRDGKAEKIKLDNFDRAAAVFAGVNGPVLVISTDGKAALVRPDGQATVADSLVELAKRRFAELLAAAPTVAPGSAGRWLDTFSEPGRPTSPPWLRTGRALWLLAADRLWRVTEDSASELTEQIAALGVRPETPRLIGPLASGQVLLAAHPRYMTRWVVVDQPAGAFRLSRMAAPPATQSEGVEKPATVAGPLLLESTGRLLIRHEHNRLYQLAGAGQWTLLPDAGAPQAEFDGPPAGEAPPAGRQGGWVLTVRSEQGPGGQFHFLPPAGQRLLGPWQPPPMVVARLHTLSPLVTIIAPDKSSRIVAVGGSGMVWLKYPAGDPAAATMDCDWPVDWPGQPTRLIGRGSHGNTLTLIVHCSDKDRLIQLDASLPSSPAKGPTP